MPKGIVVHTGAGPENPCEEETKVLNVPGVEFIKRGPRETPEELLEALQDADVAICWHEPYTREVFNNAPRLKGVVRSGVGVDTVDLDAATEAGVVVANFPLFCLREVANHAVALMYACAKKIAQLDRAMRGEGWGAARAILTPMGSIHNETLGLFAFGNIAQAVAKRGICLDMDVIAYDPFVDKGVFEEAGVESVGLEELAARSDYVSCHLPLNQHTQALLDESFFSLMKPTAYFINTSRGGVVREADLIAALQDNRLAGAGLDVFEAEPIDPDNPLLAMDNVVVTPHTASYADETMRSRNRDIGLFALTLLEGGVPEYVANPAVLGHRRS